LAEDIAIGRVFSPPFEMVTYGFVGSSAAKVFQSAVVQRSGENMYYSWLAILCLLFVPIG
jgi:hypothetical protein